MVSECPRCRGISIHRLNNVLKAVDGAPIIHIKTYCESCEFAVNNVVWNEDGVASPYGWYSGQEVPPAVVSYTGIPKEDW